MVSTFATNPQLTEQGFTNVFRVVGRDDLQGRIAGDLLAERWGGTPIAILRDGQAYGRGLAEETRKRLTERGIAEAMFEAIEPGKADYRDIVQKMQAMGVEVLYFGGYQHEAGLIIRQAREHGYGLHLVSGDGISNDDFALIAGRAADGTLMTYPPQPDGPAAAEFAAKFAEEGLEPAFQPYAAVQAWAQAAEKSGTFEAGAVAEGCAVTSSKPCSARSGSTTRATSPATIRSSGTSGTTAPLRRWNRASSPNEPVCRRCATRVEARVPVACGRTGENKGAARRRPP
jgi:branched-chain amino acid transport system substrate-binding protein